MSGEVLWESRIASQCSPLSAAQAIQQGEEVDIGKDGLGSISFDKTLTFTLSNNTQVAIVQTLPANLIMQLKTGSVKIEKLDSSIPVSWRGLDLLIDLQKGEYQITVNKDSS